MASIIIFATLWDYSQGVNGTSRRTKVLVASGLSPDISTLVIGYGNYLKVWTVGSRPSRNDEVVLRAKEQHISPLRDEI